MRLRLGRRLSPGKTLRWEVAFGWEDASAGKTLRWENDFDWKKAITCEVTFRPAGHERFFTFGEGSF